MNPLASLIDALCGLQQRTADTKILNAMSDRELADIGITRGDIAAALRNGRQDARTAALELLRKRQREQQVAHATPTAPLNEAA